MMRQHVIEAPKVSPAPLMGEALHAAAQVRIQRHPAGVGFFGRYTPLAVLHERAKHMPGPVTAGAVAEASQAVLDADDAAIGRMIAQGRPAPDMPNGTETAAARAAAQVDANRAQAAMAAAGSRPRVTLAEQLSALEARGIRIHAEGRHLKVNAPDGVLTDHDRTLLREHKPEILAWLAGHEETI